MTKGSAYHHGDLRRALIAATVELVEQTGPEGFTLRAAAKRAGVSDAAPYHHFADKDALLAAVAQEGFEKLTEALVTAAGDESKEEQPADGSKRSDEVARDRARARGQRMGVAYVLFAAEHPGYFRAMFSSASGRRERFPALAEAASRAFLLVRETIVQGLTEAEARLPQEHVIAASWGLAHGLAFLALDGHLPQAKDPESLERLTWGAIHALDRHSD